MKKSTWIILGLVAVLGVVYVATKPSKISVGVKRLELPAFDQSKVDRIEIKGKDPATLVKEQGEWFLEIGAPENIRRVKADQAIVARMLETALELKHSHYVTSLEEKLSDLGLAHENVTTINILSGDKPLWSLLLGKNDEEGGRYAKLADKPEVYVVHGAFWQLTKSKADEWRDRTLWRVPEAEVMSFEVTRDKKPYLLLKRAEDGKDWSLDKSISSLPESFRAEKAALANLVRLSLNLNASGFVDEKKDLGDPFATLSATKKDGTKQELLVFSTPGPNYWVKNTSGEQVFELPKSNFDRIIKPISELRDLSLMNIDKNQITKLSLATKKGRVVLEKSENQWQIKEPKQLPKDFEFDASMPDYILTMVAELHGERLANPSKDKPAHDAWKSSPLLELQDKDNKKINLYGTKSKTNPKEYLVQGNIDQEIYIVKADNLELLSRELDAFKKEEFKLPPIDEHTKGFESLPVDVQRKLLDATKQQQH